MTGINLPVIQFSRLTRYSLLFNSNPSGARLPFFYNSSNDYRNSHPFVWPEIDTWLIFTAETCTNVKMDQKAVS